MHESLKDIYTMKIKDFVENPVLTKADIAVSKIIGMMLKEKVHEVFIQLPDEAISCINIRDI